MSEGATSNVLGSNTGQYAPDGPSDVTVTLVSEGYWPPFAQCVILIICSGLKTLCRVDRTSVHNIH